MPSEQHATSGFDDPQFRAGVAYTVHLFRHAVGIAHGGDGAVPALPGMHRCCAENLVDFVTGMADGLTPYVGTGVDHDHPEAAR